jgi:hypothetical protein
MPRTTPELQVFIDEFNEYVATVAVPPYFGDTQPSMPVFAYYDNTMGPDALPLQFVRLPLNGYIPTLFLNSDLGGTDLPALYEAAKVFFYLEETASPTTSSPTTASPTPLLSFSQSPTVAPSSSSSSSEVVAPTWSSHTMQMLLMMMSTTVLVFW